MLEVEGLELDYGEIAACRDVDFSLAAREIVTLVGANGAGKTTILRGIAGAMLPRAGRIRFLGRDITRLPAHERALMGIALVPEGRRVFPQMTVRENLEMGGFKYRRDKRRQQTLMDEMFGLFPRLAERASQRAATLSGGEQQMLALSRALMSEPQLLCLDEPSLGLAPMVVQEIFRTVRAVNDRGTSILLVEQNAYYALATAQRGYVLQTGTIVASGTCAELRRDERVKEAYLGRR